MAVALGPYWVHFVWNKSEIINMEMQDGRVEQHLRLALFFVKVILRQIYAWKGNLASRLHPTVDLSHTLPVLKSLNSVCFNSPPFFSSSLFTVCLVLAGSICDTNTEVQNLKYRFVKGVHIRSISHEGISRKSPPK